MGAIGVWLRVCGGYRSLAGGVGACGYYRGVSGGAGCCRGLCWVLYGSYRGLGAVSLRHGNCMAASCAARDVGLPFALRVPAVLAAGPSGGCVAEGGPGMCPMSDQEPRHSSAVVWGARVPTPSLGCWGAGEPSLLLPVICDEQGSALLPTGEGRGQGVPEGSEHDH